MPPIRKGRRRPGPRPTQAHHLDGNALLRQAPTARADKIYTGVLYDALDLATLSPAARGRATARVAGDQLALFGVVRPGDRIPAYRLSGDANLPGTGSCRTYWRDVLAMPSGRGRHRSADRPPLLDVRRVLAARARPGAGWRRSGCCTSPTVGGRW